MSLRLTERLLTVAGRVPRGGRLADVGTDHAYLPTWLLLEGHIPSAIATDLRSGPLGRAGETVRSYGVEDRVSLRLCDGLAGVQPEEVDSVVVAGMGGETILRILGDAPWVEDKACIVQPMSSLSDLRAGLGTLGLHVARETLAREGETLYVVMDLARGAERPLTPAEMWVGRAENHWDDPLWGQYLRQEQSRVRRALDGILRGKNGDTEGQREELEAILTGLMDMMEGV